MVNEGWFCATPAVGSWMPTSAPTTTACAVLAATASLNVNAATACVLSCFAHAAGYAEERRSGAKFEVRDPLHALWKPK